MIDHCGVGRPAFVLTEHDEARAAVVGHPIKSDAIHRRATNHEIVKTIRVDVAQLGNVELFLTPDGEAQKSVNVTEEIWKKCGSVGLTRSDAIVALGGGATTDLSGFVAATWLRGIDWYAIPTTLAAMVDASIGGKTGINAEAGKNLIGAFHSPRSVFIDLQFLTSLSDRDFAAGLAEVIKTGFIADAGILISAPVCGLRPVRAAR